jgi:hypothetical protein
LVFDRKPVTPSFGLSPPFSFTGGFSMEEGYRMFVLHPETG